MTSTEGLRPGPDAEAPEAAEKRKRILLVEDSEADREVYGGLLWYNGYDVLHAGDGETAVATALESRPDLILLDLVLPGEMMGLDVADRLRSEGMDVPIVVLSAVPRADHGSTLERLDIAAYLEKPIEPVAVVREVMHQVGGAQPRES